MGCTLNYTANDHAQAMKSIGRPVIKEASKFSLTSERRVQIRAVLNRASSQTLLNILSNPKHPAYEPVKGLLEKSFASEMTPAEAQKLPEAFLTIIKRHPDAMGLFVKAPAHRGPGTSPVQHHYEILSAAALMKKTFTTVAGKSLVISSGDHVDFGIKFAKDYAQPRRHGTIEADILVHKGIIMDAKTVGVDSKYSKTGKYTQKPGLQRQLDGIRTGFRDGKIDEFIYVTNGKFAGKFQEKVQEMNLMIAKDFAEQANKLYKDVPSELLRKEEKQNIPAGKLSPDFFNKYTDEVKDFVTGYNVPQIDMCHHVKFPGT